MIKTYDTCLACGATIGIGMQCPCQVASAVETLKSFIEYAEKTRKFHDVGNYETIRSVLLGQQAKIDALMWEFCPEDMTEAQIKEYEKNQIKAPD